MKQKINVEIHKSGNCNADILAMVAANNGTGPYVSMSDIKGLLKYSRIKWPNTCGELTYSKDSGSDTLHIYEDGSGKPTLTLEWVEVTEEVLVD